MWERTCTRCNPAQRDCAPAYAPAGSGSRRWHVRHSVDPAGRGGRKGRPPKRPPTTRTSCPSPGGAGRGAQPVRTPRLKPARLGPTVWSHIRRRDPITGDPRFEIRGLRLPCPPFPPTLPHPPVAHDADEGGGWGGRRVGEEKGAASSLSSVSLRLRLGAPGALTEQTHQALCFRPVQLPRRPARRRTSSTPPPATFTSKSVTYSAFRNASLKKRQALRRTCSTLRRTSRHPWLSKSCP